MTVVDVNTGKFTGSGGNLEETVTKNNLEAAEEIVRQLRLRDIGGIIVVDFIDMVLESNRDLVLRRLVECLGRDRTRHQVAEVTSLGLVQMTRKRIGTGLLEAFSENCEHCQGRGLVLHDLPVEPKGGGPTTTRAAVAAAAVAAAAVADAGGGRGDGPGRRRQPTATATATPAVPVAQGRRGDGPRARPRRRAGEAAAAVEAPEAEPVEIASRGRPADGRAVETPQPTPATEAPASRSRPPEPTRPGRSRAVEPEPRQPTRARGRDGRRPAGPAEPPKVVTRTRRRGGTSRTAGNATVAADVPASRRGGRDRRGPRRTAAGRPGGARDRRRRARGRRSTHVPIKRKGRKR